MKYEYGAMIEWYLNDSEENASQYHSVHYKMIKKEDVLKSGSISFVLLKLYSFSMILELTKISFLSFFLILCLLDRASL